MTETILKELLKLVNEHKDLDYKPNHCDICKRIDFLKSELGKGFNIIERLENEIIECDKDYDRHQIPCDWNNISCTGTVESVLNSIKTGSKIEL